MHGVVEPSQQNRHQTSLLDDPNSEKSPAALDSDSSAQYTRAGK
jgi:hypothetical protein